MAAEDEVALTGARNTTLHYKKPRRNVVCPPSGLAREAGG